MFTGVPGVIFGAIALSDIGRSRGKLRGHGLAVGGIVTGTIGTLAAIPLLLIALLLPAVKNVRDAAVRVQSSNNLTLIALAMLNHSITHGAFPAASGGAGVHAGLSWRVTLLPDLGEDQLYKRFRLDEPWDSPNNKPLLAAMPRVYELPGAGDPSGMTHYRVFVGPRAAFRPPAPGETVAKGLTLTDFANRGVNTILVAEAADAVPWTKPEELPFADDRPLPRLGCRGANFSVVMFDGSVRSLAADMPEVELRALIATKNEEPPVPPAAPLLAGPPPVFPRGVDLRRQRPELPVQDPGGIRLRPREISPAADLPSLPAGDTYRFLLSRRGPRQKSDILLCDFHNGSIRVLQNLTNQLGNNTWPSWSPNGRHIAFSSDREGSSHVYVMDADGGNVRRLTNDKDSDDQTTWSPDGRRIAFRRNWNTFLINPDGSGIVLLNGRTRATMGVNVDPAWSPDGRRLAYTSLRPGVMNYQVIVIHPDGSAKETVLPADNRLGSVYPSWSPDGRQIVYSDRVDGALELFLAAPDGGGCRQLTHAGGWNVLAGWTPDGKWIAFIHKGAAPGDRSLLMTDPVNGRLFRVDGDLGSDDGGRLSWQPPNVTKPAGEAIRP